MILLFVRKLYENMCFKVFGILVKVVMGLLLKFIESNKYVLYLNKDYYILLLYFNKMSKDVIVFNFGEDYLFCVKLWKR